MDLEKLNFKTFLKNSGQMYALLDENRARLSPWFWWADNKTSPNKFRFDLFMALYILDTKRKKIAHTFNHQKLYDEQFFIYNETGQIGGMCGLDNIDIKKNKNAEIWILSFGGNKFGMADAAMSWVEDNSINIGLESLYAKIQSTNYKSIKLVDRNGYSVKEFSKNVRVSKRNPNFADMYTYIKLLNR